MPDFSICSNSGCEIRRRCYRHMAKPAEYEQSYTTFHPVIDEQGNFVDCNFFKPFPIEQFKSKKSKSGFLRDIYEGHFIYENSIDATHIFYEVNSPEDEPLAFTFDTIEECKKHIDNILIKLQS